MAFWRLFRMAFWMPFWGAVLGAFARGVISRSQPYRRSLFCAPNICSVPEKPVFYTECFRKRFAYRRRLFCAPSANSVP